MDLVQQQFDCMSASVGGRRRIIPQDLKTSVGHLVVMQPARGMHAGSEAKTNYVKTW
jgi:hypothetical protein